jgi:molybdenum cofactor cytidylyltransferase
MKFGPLPTAEAEGTRLAHTVQHGGRLFRKGHVLTADDLATLEDFGVETVVVAQLDAYDVPENEAASSLSEALAGDGIRVAGAFTGRANLYATVPGVFCVRGEAIDAINSIDEALTIATLPTFDAVERGAMLATVKIIPYAVRQASLDAALSLAKTLGPVAEVSPYRSMKVGLISTSLPQTKPTLHQKNRSTLEARLRPTGAQIISEQIVEHSAPAVGSAICHALGEASEIILVYSASAIADRADVVPAGLLSAGGDLIRFGMPVDPGNLLLLGRIGHIPVVGLPGCARSPKLNGFDWVLQRLLSGLPVTGDGIARMGVGGLLKEIPSRPHPRDRIAPVQAEAPVASIILAAGRSTRMGTTKQLAEVNGMPMVRQAAMTALSAKASPVVVVTGHDAAAVSAALADLDVAIVHNPYFSDGLSTSLITGLEAVANQVCGALIMLGDMPLITEADISTLLDAFRKAEDTRIIVATHLGRTGNPVIWPAAYFDEIKKLKGDVGAKSLLKHYSEVVSEVEIGRGALIDIDTPQDLNLIKEYRQE